MDKSNNSRKDTQDNNLSSSSKLTTDSANDHNYSSNNETSSSVNIKINSNVSSSNSKDNKDNDEHVVSQGRPKKRIKSSNENVSSSSSSSNKNSVNEQVSSASSSSSKKSTSQRNHQNKKEASSSSQISSGSNHISSSSKEDKLNDADQSQNLNDITDASSTSEETTTKKSNLSSSTVNQSSKDNKESLSESSSQQPNLPRVPPLRIVINSSSNLNKKDSEKLVSSSNISTSSVSLSNSSSHIHSTSTNEKSLFSIDNSNQSTNNLSINVTSSSTFINTSSINLDDLENGEENASSSKDLSNLTSTGRVTRSQRAAQQTSTINEDININNSCSQSSKKEDNNETGNKNQDNSGKDLRKRKNRFKVNQNSSSNSNQNKQQHLNEDDDNDSTSSSNSSVNNKELNQLVNNQLQNLEKRQFQMPSYNCYHLYLNIRRQVDHRRTQQTKTVHPKIPDNFNQFLFNTGSYLLDTEGNKFAASISDRNKDFILALKSDPNVEIPKNLIDASMRSLFVEQDLERRKLSLQHRIEKDKLRLSAEQEILRVYARAELAMANLNLPLLSACTVLKDEEIYNSIDEENDASLDNNERLFSSSPNEFANSSLNNNKSTENALEEKIKNQTDKSRDFKLNDWLQDVNEKWNKIKRDILLRQKREAESLQAIQQLNWQWKFDFCDKPNNNLCIEDVFVPLVKVEDFCVFNESSMTNRQ